MGGVRQCSFGVCGRPLHTRDPRVMVAAMVAGAGWQEGILDQERDGGNVQAALTVPTIRSFSGKLGATVSDLCQHVDQHFEIGGLYTFKQPMNLLMNWVLDHSEQFLA